MREFYQNDSGQFTPNLWKKKSARGNNKLASERGEIMEKVGSINNELASECGEIMKRSAQGNNQLASERREIMKCIKLNVKQKFKGRNKPGFETQRVLAVTISIFTLRVISHFAKEIFFYFAPTFAFQCP